MNATAKAMLLVWVLSISIVLFTYSESESDCDVANDCYHLGLIPILATLQSLSLYVKELLW